MGGRIVQKFGIVAAAVALIMATLATPTYATVANWQQGMSLVPTSTTDLASDAGKRSIDQLATTGANYVTIIIPYYQSSLTSSDLHPGGDTPSDDTLRSVVAYAHTKGIHVMLKPHLEVGSGIWRARIDPTDRNAWYKAYGDMLVHYAQIARATGVEEICIGTEMTDTASYRVHADNTERWQGMIRRVRGVYNGRLTYSTQYGYTFTQIDKIGFWAQLDDIGVSAYYSLPTTGTPTVTQLKADWAKYEQNVIRPLHTKYGKPVLFTELGYRSLVDARNDPWNYSRQGAVDMAEQARLYTALFSFWNTISYFRGVDLWYWEPNPNAGGPNSTSFTPQNKTAQTVMAHWFGGQTSTTPPPTGSATIENWWPTEGAWLAGGQPFKARIPGRDLSTYRMYWRVDNGQLNPMYDSQQDAPHKEAWVDVSSWYWRGSGPYNIQFAAYDSSGKLITYKTVHIYVSH